MIKEFRVFPLPGIGTDTSIWTQFRTDMQTFIDGGHASFDPIKKALQKLLTGNPSLATAPGYFAAAPAQASAFGVGIGDTTAGQSSTKKAPFRTAASHAAVPMCSM
jgi:hypothetical protein